MKRFAITLVALALLFGAGLAGRAAAAGTAPVAGNLELRTRRGQALWGTLTARDPDGDVVRYVITTAPVKGRIQLGSGGRFVYLPRPDKKGRDYFGYRAIDAAGNVSQEATALIRIEA